MLKVSCDKLVLELLLDTPSSHGLGVVLRASASFHIHCPFFGEGLSVALLTKLPTSAFPS